MKHIYDIKNVKTGNVEYRGLTAGEVKRAIGIDCSAIMRYIASGTAYKGQYSMTLVGTADGWENRFANEWECARQKLLRATSRRNRNNERK